MGDSSRDVLEKKLAAETESAVQEVQTNGAPTKQRLETLRGLRELLTIQESLARPNSRARWIVAAVFVGSLLLVSLLLWSRVRETEVFLDLEVTQASFRLAADDVLIDDADAVSIDLSGFDSGTVRRTADWAGLALSSENSPSGSFAIEAAAPDARVTLSALELPAGARVWIEPRPNGVSLGIDGREIEVTASLLGDVRLEGDEGSETVRFDPPRQATFFLDEGAVELDLHLRDSTQALFSPQLAVEGLSFERVQRLGRRDRVTSSVRAGSVYFLALNGEELRMRSSQALTAKSSAGRIQRIEVQPESLRFEFQGEVEGLRTGSRDHPQPLMPNRLAWLRARHGLELLWVTAISIFGVVTAVVKWLGFLR